MHPFSTPWKNLMVFWCFQEVGRGCIGNEWVNIVLYISISALTLNVMVCTFPVAQGVVSTTMWRRAISYDVVSMLKWRRVSTGMILSEELFQKTFNKLLTTTVETTNHIYWKMLINKTKFEMVEKSSEIVNWSTFF